MVKYVIDLRLRELNKICGRAKGVGIPGLLLDRLGHALLPTAAALELGLELMEHLLVVGTQLLAHRLVPAGELVAVLERVVANGFWNIRNIY